MTDPWATSFSVDFGPPSGPTPEQIAAAVAVLQTAQTNLAAVSAELATALTDLQG
jgi:hypothetical protein